MTDGCNGIAEKKERLVITLSKALPNMTEFEKGYLLGKIEDKAERNLARERAEGEEKPVA